ncbi:MAG: arabinogalactan endo-1,4-beta-galactosidase [Bacteroidetes bacterium]|nr:arabinogalactan endo-1,4-beta-galactosidase [Bacteroidota bacterium]
MMKSNVFLLWISLIVSASNMDPLCAQEYAIGADLSFLKAAEDQGSTYKENGEIKKGLQIFKDHGYNWIRLRLFHTPTELPNDLEYTIALAKEAKAMGFKFLLDYHYSDTWADPGKQFIPKAWEGLDHATLVDSVYHYTQRTMKAFRKAGASPDMVQPGNEIIHGVLWPDGQIPENWDQFAELLQAGINGVLTGCENHPPPEIMIHIDQGGNKEKTKYFFDKIFNYGIDFDVIGQSYYPWWHGSLLDLRENLHFMATVYKKPIIMVEVAYCSEPTEYKDKLAPYPETPEGQKEFLESVHEMMLSTPNNLGIGIFWWEPATLGGLSHRDYFDDEGNVLPVITVFDKYTRY